MCGKSLRPSPISTLVLSPTLAADTVVQLSPDEATEATMSSEALPLIFEPLEDVVSEAASVVTPAPGSLQPPADGDGDGDGPSPTPLAPDSPWQTSGTEQLEPSAFWGPSASPHLPTGGELELHFCYFGTSSGSKLQKIVSLLIYLSDAVKMLNLEAELPTSTSSSSSEQQSLSAPAVTSHQHKPPSGLEVVESEGRRAPAARRLQHAWDEVFRRHPG